jgi:hypothetical protein
MIHGIEFLEAKNTPPSVELHSRDEVPPEAVPVPSNFGEANWSRLKF